MSTVDYRDTSHELDTVGDTMMTWMDFLALGIYFLLMAGTGIYSMCRPNRDTVVGYFLAGRFMWWLPIGASLFASNIGSEHFIGLAGSGAASGIFVGAFELNALILLQLLGWVFLPVFIASGVNTLPEYMSKRFGGSRIRTCLAILSLILYIFTKISVNMYSGAIFIQQAFRWTNLYFSVIVLVGLTAILTIAGGLSAVIYTDTLQFFIMNLGSLYVAVRAFQAIGGYERLVKEYVTAIPDKLVPNTTCGFPRTDSWVMLRSADPSVSDMPWPGFILGQTPASIWYWCADQMMVQRVMAAKSLSHAQGATIFAGYTKLLPLFLIVMPGMISRVLFPNEVGCADPVECHKFCGAHTCTNYAYPKLVFSYMPSGIRGVMLSVMLSALVSDLTSIFNSASTLFTMDIWSLVRPRATQKEQLFIGRGFVLILVVLSILWIPVIEQTQGGELYIYIQAIAAYLSPPIAAVYCLAILWKGVNESGAFWGLMFGFMVGLTRMTIDFYYREPPCYEIDTRPIFVKTFHYMYFAMVLFWFTLFIAVVISKYTKPIDKWRLMRTTYCTRFDRGERPDDYDSMRMKHNELLSAPTEVKDIYLECHELGDSKTILGTFFKEKEKSAKAKVFVLSCSYYYNLPAPLITQSLCFATYATLAVHRTEAEETKMNVHVAQLTNLHQEAWEKRLLNTMLVFIITLALCLYIYFSINPFMEEQIRELQRQKVLEILGNTTYSSNFTFEVL